MAETADELVFTAELPGMSREQVTIELEQNVLTISGERVEGRTESEAPARERGVVPGGFGRVPGPALVFRAPVIAA